MALSGTIPDNWPLVGRDDELARVQRLLAGGERGVVVAGAAGVGKTRLAAECLALATERGRVPLRVAATRASSRLPFGAFAALVPELVPGTDRAEVLRQVAAAVTARGGEALVVDNAHLLDDASAALTLQLATAGNCFVVATARSGEPASDAVVALWKDGLAERLELEPFAEEQVEELLGAVLGGPADAATVRVLWERSRGNAMFLRELVVAALEAGTLVDQGGLWRLAGRLPASTRLVELVEGRLSGLGDVERALLEVVALGEPLGLDQLGAPAAEAVLSTLERRALVGVDQDGRRLRVRLAHPLYGDVLRSRLSPLSTQAVSAMLAEAVTASGARRRDDVLRVATWSLQAGGTLDPDVMVVAARQAFARHDLALAERLARAAYQADGGFEAGLQLGLVLSHRGRMEEAEDLLCGLEPATDAERTTLALTRILNLFHGGQLERAVRIVDAAEAEITDPAGRDEVQAWRPVFLTMAGEIAEARRTATSLLPRVTGRSFVMVAATAAWTLATCGATDAALDATERARAAHRSLQGPPLWYGLYLHAFTHCEALTWAGRLSEAEAMANAEYAQAVADGSRAAQAWLALAMARTMLAQGRCRPRRVGPAGRLGVPRGRAAHHDRLHLMSACRPR